MPFPLAHPAAVLPLRRYCPRFFNFPALIVGSLSPDAGYCFGRLNIEEFSHSFIGGFGFGLPAGIVMLGLFYGLRSLVVGILPNRQRQILLPLCRRPFGSPFVAVVSLLVGIWTHLLLDSFTHKHGWLVEHLPILQAPIVSVDNRTLRLCNVIWYVCSFVAVAWLYFVYEHWTETIDMTAHRSSIWARIRNAFLVGILVLPIAMIHTLINGLLGICLSAISLLSG